MSTKIFTNNVLTDKVNKLNEKNNVIGDSLTKILTASFDATDIATTAVDCVFTLPEIEGTILSVEYKLFDGMGNVIEVVDLEGDATDANTGNAKKTFEILGSNTLDTETMNYEEGSFFTGLSIVSANWAGGTTLYGILKVNYTLAA